MAFYDDLIFPPSISLYAFSGKRSRKNATGENQGGFEQTEIIWQRTRRSYDAGMVPRPPAQWLELEAFWESCVGSAHGFRLQDPTDFTAAHANGLLWPVDAAGNVLGGAGYGYGVPTLRAHKQIGVAAHPVYRELRKLFGAFEARRGGSGLTAGGGAGQYASDANTGIVTMVADSSSAVTAVTVGATTQVTLTAALAGLATSGRLYVSGLTGAHAALLNGLSHSISAIGGGGSNVYTLATNTAGKTITVGAGVGYKYPQPSETMTFASLFHTPCKFVSDDLDWSAVTRSSEGLWLMNQSIAIREIRLRNE